MRAFLSVLLLLKNLYENARKRYGSHVILGVDVSACSVHKRISCPSDIQLCGHLLTTTKVNYR